MDLPRFGQSIDYGESAYHCDETNKPKAVDFTIFNNRLTFDLCSLKMGY